MSDPHTMTSQNYAAGDPINLSDRGGESWDDSWDTAKAGWNAFTELPNTQCLWGFGEGVAAVALGTFVANYVGIEWFPRKYGQVVKPRFRSTSELDSSVAAADCGVTMSKKKKHTMRDYLGFREGPRTRRDWLIMLFVIAPLSLAILALIDRYLP